MRTNRFSNHHMATCGMPPSYWNENRIDRNKNFQDINSIRICDKKIGTCINCKEISRGLLRRIRRQKHSHFFYFDISISNCALDEGCVGLDASGNKCEEMAKDQDQRNANIPTDFDLQRFGKIFNLQ
ncbi:hypothetical protein SNEBB_005023 [Seison nebaliae]|nr:hypothetical protein SNEBB_005023 [Seison nebaliae]